MVTPSLLPRPLFFSLVFFCFWGVLQVTHGAGAFEAGDSVILTLKDQGLLEEDEHGRVTGLKDDEDELENVHMKEAEVSGQSDGATRTFSRPWIYLKFYVSGKKKKKNEKKMKKKKRKEKRIVLSWSPSSL